MYPKNTLTASFLTYCLNQCHLYMVSLEREAGNFGTFVCLSVWMWSTFVKKRLLRRTSPVWLVKFSELVVKCIRMKYPLEYLLLPKPFSFSWKTSASYICCNWYFLTCIWSPDIGHLIEAFTSPSRFLELKWPARIFIKLKLRNKTEGKIKHAVLIKYTLE